jgi:hypothetical protein
MKSPITTEKTTTPAGWHILMRDPNIPIQYARTNNDDLLAAIRPSRTLRAGFADGLLHASRTT